MMKKRLSVPKGLMFFLFCCAAAGFATALSPDPGSGQAAPSPLTVEAVTGNLYLVKGGSGANTAFYVTTKEVFVIDAKMSPGSAEEMLREIGKVAKAPVTTIILTHSDGDHINGLPGFPKGLRIVAHPNCKADVEAAAEADPALKDFIPNKTYEGTKLTLTRTEDGWVDLVHLGPAHTNGDTIVWFPAEKAAFVGDLVFVGRDPLIHRHKNGNSFGYVKTLRTMLKLSPEVDIFLSGHADPLGRADIEALAAALEEKQAKVKAMVDEGKSLDEIKKAFGIEEPAGQPPRRWPSFVETVYLELTGK
jgi:glyoxylase-like metal-dependent hydrolase (beta-lactamase superfamily II)